MSARVCWVIPCYNESSRLPKAELESLLRTPQTSIVLVNDGSSDDTGEVLDRLAAENDKIVAHHLGQNAGKAEAVRRGLLLATEREFDVVGYLDADFATPAAEAKRLQEAANGEHVAVVLGSRWRHMGADIDRTTVRHFAGRIFATIASAGLGIPVYDTQCGAKLFRNSDSFAKAIAAPFSMDLAFDVELLARLLDCGITPDEIVEVPLNEWTDVANSKLRVSSIARSFYKIGRFALSRQLRSKRPR